MKIYVASSWKSSHRHELVVFALKDLGHEVYDYRTDGAFHWSQVDENYKNWSVEEFKEGLKHPSARKGFATDFYNMERSDICILILPSGRSSHLEAGWFAGRGKPLYILTQEGEPAELTYSLANLVTTNLDEILEKLK